MDGNGVAAAAVDDDGDVNVNFISFLLFSTMRRYIDILRKENNNNNNYYYYYCY